MLVNEEPYQLGDSYYLHELVRDTAIAQAAPVEEGVFGCRSRCFQHHPRRMAFRPTSREVAAGRVPSYSGISLTQAQVRVSYLG